MARSARSTQHHHPMRVVTRRTGLSADLLRAWERRYEVVAPARSASGRRLYSDADIERLRLLYRATLAGRSIGQVADLPTDALAALVRRDGSADAEAGRGSPGSPAPDGGVPPSASDFLDDAFRAVARLDATAVDAVLRRAVIALPVAALLDTVIVPLLERVGTGWREGTLRPVHEHLAGAVLRRVLERIVESASSPFATANLVVATPTGQVHEFGALLVAAAAAAEGWRVTYLGADLPAEDIAEAAIRTRARGVALSVVYPTGDPAIGDEMRRLRQALPEDVTVLVGGAAATTYASSLHEIGAVPLDSLRGLRATLASLRRCRRRPGEPP